MRKIYLVPNFVTTANMFAGFYSIIASIRGEINLAAWSILAAAVFDMLDGRIARLAKATSKFGVEYDSLSDLLSFGVAPGILLYQWALAPFGRLGYLAAFLMVACAALRLARFNVTTAIQPKAYFQGMPTPISAGTVATYVIFHHYVAWPDEAGVVSRENLVLFLAVFLSSLMISTLRFPSFKELNWRSRASFGYLMVGVMSMILVAAKPEIALFLALSTYIVFSLAWNFLIWTRGPSRSERTKAARAAELVEQGSHGQGD